MQISSRGCFLSKCRVCKKKECDRLSLIYDGTARRHDRAGGGDVHTGCVLWCVLCGIEGGVWCVVWYVMS